MSKVIDLPEFKQHLDRLKAATVDRFTPAKLADWITEHTFIGDKRFSFHNHEYQEKIARCEAQEINVIKPSQVGISELSARISLAYMATYKNFTVIYTLPTATFASTFMKTRIDPIIATSKYLERLVVTSMDNSEVKQFGTNFLHMKGAQSTNAPISVPADLLIHDELDFSSPEVISQYQSRLSHSPHKKKIRLSTPTSAKTGISAEFSKSKRFNNFVRCNHCNHFFIPDYYEHVVVPGSPNLDLRTITKANMFMYRTQEAYVQCPKCHKQPSLQPEHREWVCENPSENHIAHGFQVSPFDAPNIVSPGYLIQASTTYKRVTDFVNFALGKPAEDSESTLLESDITKMVIEPQAVGFGEYYMGIDLGMTCHIVILHSQLGQMIVVYTEKVHVSHLETRRQELARQFRVRVTVSDAMPYTDLVLRMQSTDFNLYGAIYTRVKGLELYTVKDRDENAEAGIQELRQININRDRVFDVLMDDIRRGFIKKISDQHDREWIQHCTDMVRIRTYDSNDEMIFTWKKSEEGNDHFWHTLGYAYIAAQITGVAGVLYVPPFFAARASLNIDKKK